MLKILNQTISAAWPPQSQGIKYHIWPGENPASYKNGLFKQSLLELVDRCIGYAVSPDVAFDSAVCITNPT